MSAAPPNQRHRVLLIDGDVRTSQRLARLLAEDGFEVETLRDGASAIERLLHQPLPHTLITELSLPSMDGAAVARFALSRSPTIRIVVLTRYANAPIPDAFGAPPPVVFGKPLDYPRLLELLKDDMAPVMSGLGAASPER